MGCCECKNQYKFMGSFWLQIYVKLTNVSNSVKQISTVCAQNDVQIDQEYLTDNGEHHDLLIPENGKNNLVLSIALDQ